MTWIATLVLCVVLVEIFFRLPFGGLVGKARRTAVRALWALRARRVSDHWKEKVMVAYSGRMFSCSFALAGLLIVLAAGVVLFVLAVELLVPGFAQFLSSWLGIVASIVMASLYVLIRKRVLHDRLRSSRQVAASAGPAIGTGRRTEL